MFSSILGIAAVYSFCICYRIFLEKRFWGDRIRFSDAIEEAAAAHGVHPALVAAVIHAESNFMPRARSYAGAKGLMQINPPTQRYLRVRRYAGMPPYRQTKKYVNKVLAYYKHYRQVFAFNHLIS